MSRPTRGTKAAPSRRTLLTRWSLSVRQRDGNKCCVCGTDKHIQAHHILPKERYKSLQFEGMNGVGLCPSHHKFGKLSAHRNPIWFVLWLGEARPEQLAWAKERIEL